LLIASLQKKNSFFAVIFYWNNQENVKEKGA